MSKAISVSWASGRPAKRSGRSSSRTRAPSAASRSAAAVKAACPSASARSHHGVRATATASGRFASSASWPAGHPSASTPAEEGEVLGFAREPAERVEVARSAP